MHLACLDSVQWKLWAKDDTPILVGPWHSEVGFETLYFLPWLTHWRETYGIAKDRLFIVTRGGAGPWYGTHQTIDLFDYLPPKELRQHTLAQWQASGSVKQTAIQPWEREMYPRFLRTFGLANAHWLHPRAMYQGLQGWWANTQTLAMLTQQVTFQAVPVSHPPLDLALPEQFIAIGFYARPTWLLNDETKTYVQSLVDLISKTLPVVLIASSLHADDHLPFPIKGAHLSTAPFCTPTTSLAIQASVIAKSQAFIGTYGGLMQLAVRLGKPSVGLFTQFGQTAYAHKLLTEYLATVQGTPVYIGRPQDWRRVPMVGV